MTQTEIVAFLREQKWAVEATASPGGRPQAALVGFVVTDELELFFDTLGSSRKMANLEVNPRVAFVIGGWLPGDERTVQYEGVASFPTSAELAELQKIYFAAFPDGPSRLAWLGITYVRVRPLWVRFSDFRAIPPQIHELTFGTGA